MVACSASSNLPDIWMTDFDVDALLVCLAPALDLRYEQLYGFLQDDVTRRQQRQPDSRSALRAEAGTPAQTGTFFHRYAACSKYRLLERVGDTRNDSPHISGSACARQ